MRLLASIGYQLLLSGGVIEPDRPSVSLNDAVVAFLRCGGVDASLVALE